MDDTGNVRAVSKRHQFVRRHRRSTRSSHRSDRRRRQKSYRSRRPDIGEKWMVEFKTSVDDGYQSRRSLAGLNCARIPEIDQLWCVLRTGR